MECSAALAMNDLAVTMVFPEKHLMSRLLNEEVAEFYENKYVANGVTLIKEQLATAFEGSDGKVLLAVPCMSNATVLFLVCSAVITCSSFAKFG